VVDHLDARDRRSQRAGIAQVAGRELDPGGVEVLVTAAVAAHEGANLMPGGGQRARQVAAGEPRRSGD